MATFVFESGVLSAEQLAQAINAVMRSQNDKLRGVGDCLRVVPESVIFVDKEVNRPFIEAAREVTSLREFK